MLSFSHTCPPTTKLCAMLFHTHIKYIFVAGKPHVQAKTTIGLCFAGTASVTNDMESDLSTDDCAIPWEVQEAVLSSPVLTLLTGCQHYLTIRLVNSGTKVWNSRGSNG